MLARVGIKTSVQAQTKSKLYSKVFLPSGNQTSMYFFGWTPSFTDAHNPLLNLVSCRNSKTATGQFNLGGYCNSRVDALIDAIAVEIHEAKRNAIIKEAYTIVRQDFAYLPLHEQPMSWGVKDTIKLIQRPDDILDLRHVVMP